MASPKDKEDKMERMVSNWRTLAPDRSFGGLTVAQFDEAAARPRTARQRIEELNAQLAEAIAERDAADADFALKEERVVNGVRADPDFGPDSALYAAFGYIRKSERKSGLTRKGKKLPEK